MLYVLVSIDPIQDRALPGYMSHLVPPQAHSIIVADDFPRVMVGLVVDVVMVHVGGTNFIDGHQVVSE